MIKVQTFYEELVKKFGQNLKFCKKIRSKFGSSSILTELELNILLNESNSNSMKFNSKFIYGSTWIFNSWNQTQMWKYIYSYNIRWVKLLNKMYKIFTLAHCVYYFFEILIAYN